MTTRAAIAEKAGEIERLCERLRADGELLARAGVDGRASSNMAEAAAVILDLSSDLARVTAERDAMERHLAEAMSNLSRLTSVDSDYASAAARLAEIAVLSHEALTVEGISAPLALQTIRTLARPAQEPKENDDG